MNLEEYISSGIIESYVLGLASTEESAEFERMCAAHSQVMAARNAFEGQLESSLLRNKLEPPREIKSRIFSEIGMEKDRPTAQVISKARPKLVPKVGFSRYVAAASLILLAGSVLLNLYLLNQYKQSIAQYQDLLSTQTLNAQANQVMQTRLENYESAMNLMKSPLMTIVKMDAVPNSPDPSGMATVYWNTQSKDVYLLVNKLPKINPEKQYQLWAMVDGKPVDAGVINMEGGISFVKLKNIPKAEAFAITLEKKGGSPVPNMEALYVLGKVTS